MIIEWPRRLVRVIWRWLRWSRNDLYVPVKPEWDWTNYKRD